MGWSPDWARSLDVSPLAVVLVWIACLFCSILVHELGHALAARQFGWPPKIMLYYFGGLAMYHPTSRNTPARSIWIALAGPFAGFVLFGLIMGLQEFLVKSGTRISPLSAYALLQLRYINLWWGLVNLLPVLPLDGGRVAQEVCQLVNPRRGDSVAMRIGILTGTVVCLYFAQMQRLYPAFLFGYLAYMNVQSLQARQRGPW